MDFQDYIVSSSLRAFLIAEFLLLIFGTDSCSISSCTASHEIYHRLVLHKKRNVMTSSTYRRKLIVKDGRTVERKLLQSSQQTNYMNIVDVYSLIFSRASHTKCLLLIVKFWKCLIMLS